MAGVPWQTLGPERLVHLKEALSTNSEAMRLAAEGAPSGTWVLADRQTAGRGRSGRAWDAGPGNFAASVVIRDVFPLEKAAQVSLVCGVAVHDALMAAAAGSLDAPLELKWPNDLMCGRAKIGGILVESSVGRRDDGALAVVGIGLNLTSHPDIPGRRVTHLSAHGAAISPLNLLVFIDESLQEWLRVWSAGAGFETVRQAWLARSLPPGTALTVQAAAGELIGCFAGLDAEGAMLLDGVDGQLTISFGDVFVAS